MRPVIEGSTTRVNVSTKIVGMRNSLPTRLNGTTGPAPVLFGAGYVRMADWWRLGGAVSVVNLLVWLGLGGLWWKTLGLW